MQPDSNGTSLTVLEKKAVKAALASNWEESIRLNTQILEKYPDNISARNRLGRAYLQTKDFATAKKLFKEVLDVDPINATAKKNYELAKAKKTEKTTLKAKAKDFLKEPGSSTEAKIQITSESKAKDLSPGEDLVLRIKKSEVTVHTEDNSKIGVIEGPEDLIKRLNNAKRQNAEITADYIKRKNGTASVLIKSSIPVFKAEKQEVKPYLKKDVIDSEENSD